MPSSHLTLGHLPLLLPSIFPNIRVFSNESVLRIRWPKVWNFSFNISPFNEHSGLITFKMDWLDLLAVQGTLKNLLQHHSSKTSILRRSAFFIVQLSHPYMTTGKTIALTRRAFVGTVMEIHMVGPITRRVMCLLCSQPGLGSTNDPPLTLGVSPTHTAIADTFPARSSWQPPNNPPRWKLERAGS